MEKFLSELGLWSILGGFWILGEAVATLIMRGIH